MLVNATTYLKHLIVGLVCAGLVWRLILRDEVPKICMQNILNGETQCRPKCHPGSFSLFGMNHCHPWLTCDDVKNDLVVFPLSLGYGAIKKVYKASWFGHTVAVAYLRDKAYDQDFLHNLQMLKMFNGDLTLDPCTVVQLIGWCEESIPMVVTEFHSWSSADKLDSLFNLQFQHLDSLMKRFDLCINLVKILAILHSHSNGTRVLCDMNDPAKALSQFLLSDDLQLVLNDMDALPVVDKENNILVKCGHKELYGDYVAPEQTWPYEGEPFDDAQMPGYDEKVDVWKVPDVCNAIIGQVDGANKLKLHLFRIHSKCKEHNPSARPDAKEIFQVYKSVRRKLLAEQKHY